MPPRDIKDSNWPKSGATEAIKGDNGAQTKMASNRRNADNLGRASGTHGVELVPGQKSINQQGQRWVYGQVRLYWWQLGGLEWGMKL